MKKRIATTKVIFRKWKSSGDIIAFFPELPADNSTCESYEHLGQHAAADYIGCLSATVPATASEYKSLFKELTDIGYDLKVVRRVSPRMRHNHDMYRIFVEE